MAVEPVVWRATLPEAVVIKTFPRSDAHIEQARYLRAVTWPKERPEPLSATIRRSGLDQADALGAEIEKLELADVAMTDRWNELIYRLSMLAKGGSPYEGEDSEELLGALEIRIMKLEKSHELLVSDVLAATGCTTITAARRVLRN